MKGYWACDAKARRELEDSDSKRRDVRDRLVPFALVFVTFVVSTGPFTVEMNIYIYNTARLYGGKLNAKWGWAESKKAYHPSKIGEQQ